MSHAVAPASEDTDDAQSPNWRDMTALERIHRAQATTEKLQEQLGVVSETLDKAEQVVVAGEKVRHNARTILIVGGIAVASIAVVVVVVRRRRRAREE
ncbi:MAG: hypothetical protein KDC39_14505 [Actinobacteria bacterium]|nr:hypothetical protein [Actinomycetota bacterium]